MEASSLSQKRKIPSCAGKRSVRSKYTSRACQECRRRRSKCDGEKPLCKRCLRSGIQCLYPVDEDNRGTAPKTLVRSLQARIKLLEEALSLRSTNGTSSISGTGDLASPLNGALTIHPKGSSSKIVGVMPQDGQLKFDHQGKALYFGASSGRIELSQSPDDCEEYLAVSDPPSQILQTMNKQIVDHSSNISHELRDDLVSLYFKWELPWFQLLDEELFRQSWKTGGRFSSPLLLNCILAVASRYSDSPDVRSNPDDPNTAGQPFLETAEVLLHFDLRSPSITTIQSLGILAIIYVAIGADDKGWLRHGMAIRLALDMGFNLDASVLARIHKLPPTEISLRRQIYWALYCTDKLWASYTGRVCTMLDFQAMVSLPDPDPLNSNEGNVRSGRDRRFLLQTLHRALSTQCQVLEKILVNLYAPKRLSSMDARQMFLDLCLAELRDWKDHLPAELQTDDLTCEDIAPHAFILEMVYHTSIILLAKPFLLNKPSDMASDHSSTIGSTINKAPFLCLDAAKAICRLGEQYQKAFGNFRRSPITATHCTLSAALVFLYRADTDGDHLNENRRNLETCLRVLQELSNSWVPAGQYWRSVQKIVQSRQAPGVGVAQSSNTTSLHLQYPPVNAKETPFHESPSEATPSMIQPYMMPSDTDLFDMTVEDSSFPNLFPPGFPFTIDELMMLNTPLDLPSTGLEASNASIRDKDNSNSDFTCDI